MATNPSVYKIGFRSALLAFLSAIAYCVVQILQVSNITHFPLDGILIFGTSLCIVIPFVLSIVAFHYIVPVEKKFWSHSALAFTIMYAVFVTANYVVQLATVIPAHVRGEGAALAILDQTPHSMFWDYDALGYIFMGLATLFSAGALRKTGFEKWVRFCFIANAAVTPLISFVYFYPKFSTTILIVGYPWAVTAPLSMLMLAILFKKKLSVDN